MIVAIQGTYQDGKIILNEKPAFSVEQDVTVIFETEKNQPRVRKAGSLKGKIHMSDDFDEPIDEMKEYM